MRRAVLLSCVALAGCTWSNSLYQARLLSGQASQAEREHRPAEAIQIWGQVIVKGDSAYARSPQGKAGAEALWLAGHAAVRANDCGRAIPRLQSAMSAGRDAPWRQQLLFELALCEEPLGGATAVSLYTTLISSATDPAILRRARLRLGHALVLREEWEPALTALAGLDTLPAQLDRALALAALGRGSEMLTALSLPLANSDTSVRWIRFIDAIGPRNTAATDSLLARLAGFRNVSADQQSLWLLAAARAALVSDPAATDRRLQTLAARPGEGAGSDGRLLLAQLSLVRSASITELRHAIDSASHSELADDGIGARVVADKLRMARAIIVRNDAVAAGAPTGDLAMFGLGEFARDSLEAPRLGSWFFARLETQWPRSPYLGKALMARAPLERDSATQILERLHALPNSPYVRAANGEVAGLVRVTQLEDSLGRFFDRMWLARPDR